MNKRAGKGKEANGNGREDKFPPPPPSRPSNASQNQPTSEYAGYTGYDYNYYGYQYDPSQYSESQQWTPEAWQAYYAQYYSAYDGTQGDTQMQPASIPGDPGGKSKRSNHAKVDLSRQIVNAPIRTAGGKLWQDQSLHSEWDPSDFRFFVGNLGPEVHDSHLRELFERYPSFQKARVVRDKRSTKSKGYGFVSFKESDGYAQAFREMDGKYIGNRPCKLSKSTWKDRETTTGRAKQIIKHGYFGVVEREERKKQDKLKNRK